VSRTQGAACSEAAGGDHAPAPRKTRASRLIPPLPLHSTTPRPGAKRLVSLGRIAAPKPINLPSQRAEHGGNDPTVSLVPK